MNKIMTRCNPFQLAGFLLVFVVFFAGQALGQSVGKSGKNWKINFDVTAAYEDNITQNPTRGTPLFLQDSDTSFNYSGSAQYLHSFNDKWSLLADYEIDQTVYFDLGQYDLLSNSWGLKPKYKISPNAFIELQYMYMWNVVGGNSFNGVNYISPSYMRSFGEWGITNVRFFYSNTDNFQNQARDADEFGGSISHIYIFPGTSNYVGVGYDISDEDTAGRFDRMTHGFKLMGRYQLPMGITFKGQYKFNLRDYDTFAATTPGAIRGDDQHNYTFELSKVIASKAFFLNDLTGTIFWKRQTNDSNLVFREYRTNRIMIGLSAEF